jgi:hypothetical protein
VWRAAPWREPGESCGTPVLADSYSRCRPQHELDKLHFTKHHITKFPFPRISKKKTLHLKFCIQKEEEKKKLTRSYKNPTHSFRSSRTLFLRVGIKCTKTNTKKANPTQRNDTTLEGFLADGAIRLTERRENAREKVSIVPWPTMPNQNPPI